MAALNQLDTICSTHRTDLTTLEVDITVKSTITGKAKCTFILASADGKAPGFKLSTLGWIDW
jgi:hypothetical protein